MTYCVTITQKRAEFFRARAQLANTIMKRRNFLQTIGSTAAAIIASGTAFAATPPLPRCNPFMLRLRSYHPGAFVANLIAEGAQKVYYVKSDHVAGGFEEGVFGPAKLRDLAISSTHAKQIIYRNLNIPEAMRTLALHDTAVQLHTVMLSRHFGEVALRMCYELPDGQKFTLSLGDWHRVDKNKSKFEVVGSDHLWLHGPAVSDMLRKLARPATYATIAG